MQRHSSKESEIKISPNLLKNFNVYDVMEPEKNGAKNSDATKVDKLVDIDDCSQDSGFQDADFNPAFLDKNRDFDLVDLFQNIFVTPQHIKKKEEEKATDDVDSPFTASKVFDAGLNKFFDMFESGEKIDWTKIAQTEEKPITKHDYIEKKPRVLVPKVFTEPDSDPEDVIHEVLLQKKMEQLARGNVNSNSFKGYTREPLKRESPKIIKTSEVIPEFSHSSLNDITKDSKFKSESNEDLPRPSKIELYPVDSQINDALPNFIVRAIQKDEKVYKKKRLVKPESQTAFYTKGPDFYEKSVVLPQIMERLHARQAYLDEKNSQKKRLILDAGANPKADVNVQIKRNPNSQASTSTLNGNAQVKTKPNNKAEINSFSKNDLAKKTSNNASSSGIHSFKLYNGRVPDEPRLCINKLTKDIRVHATDRPCMNCGNPSTAKKANSPAATSTKTDYGKPSPTILMEDCNKERLRALKQSQMFKDFVLKGKYDL